MFEMRHHTWKIRSHEQCLRQVILSEEHNGKWGCNEPYFPQPLCCLRTIIVITIYTFHCINLISLTIDCWLAGRMFRLLASWHCYNVLLKQNSDLIDIRSVYYVHTGICLSLHGQYSIKYMTKNVFILFWCTIFIFRQFFKHSTFISYLFETFFLRNPIIFSPMLNETKQNHAPYWFRRVNGLLCQHNRQLVLNIQFWICKNFFPFL